MAGKCLNICYLCGTKITEKETFDHVPPVSVFPEGYRKHYNLSQLLTLPTHESCNKSYSKDEEYFRESAGAALLNKSPATKSIFRDLAATQRNGHGLGLAKTVLSEFSDKIGSIYLPPGKVAKTYDRQRFERVFWKITRGLYFHKKKVFLPENVPNLIDIFPHPDIPPKLFFPILGKPHSYWEGKYSALFDYINNEFCLLGDKTHVQMWALLFWEALLVTIIFHDPKCPCLRCRK